MDLTPEEQAEMDELRAQVARLEAERAALQVERDRALADGVQLRGVVTRLRASLDQAYQDLFQYTSVLPDTRVITYQVLVVRGQVTPRIARAVLALGGLTMAEIDGPPPSVEFRSTGPAGDASLVDAAVLLPQGHLEQRTIDLGALSAVANDVEGQHAPPAQAHGAGAGGRK